MQFVIRARTEAAKFQLQNRLYRNVNRLVTDVVGAPVELVFEV